MYSLLFQGYSDVTYPLMHNVHVCLSLSLVSYLTLTLKDFISILVYIYQILVTLNWVSTLGLANEFNLLLYQILENPPLS